MKRVVTALFLSGALLLSTFAVASANPWEAGGSNKWQGSATPCKNSGNPQKCPPHGTD